MHQVEASDSSMRMSQELPGEERLGTRRRADARLARSSAGSRRGIYVATRNCSEGQLES